MLKNVAKKHIILTYFVQQQQQQQQQQQKMYEDYVFKGLSKLALLKKT